MQEQIARDIKSAIAKLEEEDARLQAQRQQVRADIKRFQKALREIDRQPEDSGEQSRDGREPITTTDKEY